MKRSAGVPQQRSRRARRSHVCGRFRIGRQAADALRAVEPAAQEPAPPELIFGGGVHAEGRADDAARRTGDPNGSRRRHRPRPDQFRPRHERVVDRPRQRLPPQRRVEAVQLIPAVAERAAAARPRPAEIDIRVVGDVAVDAQVLDGREIAALAARGRRSRYRRGRPAPCPP